jgi:translation initiation factor IF-2
MNMTRIHELAKMLGVPSKELLSYLRSYGFSVRSASSPIPPILARLVLDEYPKAA